EPADPRGQALEGDAFTRLVEPAVQRLVVWKELLDLRVRAVDVLRIAGQRHPAERALAFAEEWPDTGGYEARVVEGVRHAGVERYLPQVVAVVDDLQPHAVVGKHGLHMSRRRGPCLRHQPLAGGIVTRIP